MADITNVPAIFDLNGSISRRFALTLIAIAAVIATLTLLTPQILQPSGLSHAAPDQILAAPNKGVFDWYVARFFLIFALAGAVVNAAATSNGHTHHPAAGNGRRNLHSQLAPASSPANGSGRHRVVVVGGGFSGLQAVRGLRRAPVDITLIDRRNFHLFQPLLYQVATGSLAASEIASPLRAILKRQRNVRVVLGEVTGFDLTGSQVLLGHLANGDAGDAVPYDTLIVAAGATHTYFGHDEWQPVAPGLKTLEDAIEIRRRILSAFEAAEVEPDPDRRRAWLTFSVVGGGPTGVELAGQIAEIARETLRRDFRAIDPREARILLLESNDRLLDAFPASLSSSAARALERLGVTPIVGRPVLLLDRESVTIQSAGSEPERIPTRTIIWAAGVRASSLAGSLGAASGADIDSAGRVTVGPDLTLPGHPTVFVLGDMIRIRDSLGEIRQFPGVCPVAMQQGRYVAKLIRARLSGKSRRPFSYLDKGNVATIGRLKAVADIRGIHFSGTLAWLVWLIVHLYYLVGFQNRFIVFTRWLGSFLTHGRGARLMTGDTYMPNTWTSTLDDNINSDRERSPARSQLKSGSSHTRTPSLQTASSRQV